MGHKIKPQSIRIGHSVDWSSVWFKRKTAYKNSLIEDLKIRQTILKKISKSGIAEVKVERDRDNITVTLLSSKPGIIIGRGGENIDKLRKDLSKMIAFLRGVKNLNIPIKIEVVEIKKPDEEAQLLSDELASLIERRTPYRRAMKQILGKVNITGSVKGVKVRLSGRLDGNEIGNVDWLIKGKVPTSTIMADVNYGESTAFCRYGTVGIKVWLYRTVMPINSRQIK